MFTGSVEVGRRVAQAAAERLCPVVLELGGKDAMLVLDDADLDRAVEGALWGVFTNCGQACAGIERIAVPPGLHDTFVERLAARARELRIGRGVDPDVELGPLVSEEQRARFEGLVADAVEHGAHGRGRRPPARHGPPGLVLRADAPARRAARRAPRRRGALRPGSRRCPNGQRRGDGALGERLAVRARRERLDARPRRARARSPTGSRPDACGTTTTPTRSAPRRRRGAAGAAPASGGPARATACTRCRT